MQNLVITSYFSSKANPQITPEGEIFAPKNSIAYIYPWYVSMSHLGLNGVIVHDGLSEEFIRKYSSQKIGFHYYEPKAYSLNDERFFGFVEVINRYEPDNVLLTDASDLFIKKDPFEFILSQKKLCFGSDMDSLPRIKDNSWCLNRAIRFVELILEKRLTLSPLSEFKTFGIFKYVNAGVIGGSSDLVRPLLDDLVKLFSGLNSDENFNMIALNYLLWHQKIDFFSGQPLTSPFKKYELDGDYYIVHK